MANIEEPPLKVPFGSLRRWLAQNSVLYRFAVYSALGNIMQSFEVKMLGQRPQKNFISIKAKHHEIFTAFDPKYRIAGLNIDDPKIQEGLRISLELFLKMKELCEKENKSFLVLLLPTKFNVFSEFIENNRNLDDFLIIDDLLMKERRINSVIQAYFKEHSIVYLDVLPALKNTINQEQIYPANYDGHPNKNGYRVIAKSVYDYIRQEMTHPQL